MRNTSISNLELTDSELVQFNIDTFFDPLVNSKEKPTLNPISKEIRPTNNMGCDMRKCVVGHMRTAKAQISLRIRAV